MSDASAVVPSTQHPAAPATYLLKDFLMMALLWISVYVVLRPLQNTPFHDDWIYAWRVQWLLEHGQLRTLEFSSNPNFVQVLWGALFCLPFGFSFIALRLSTGVLALVAMWGQYLLLREMRAPRKDCWIGAALLAFNPIFFILSFTFMTEVPFLCAMIWACYAFLKALHRQSTRWLIVSVALACLSIGIRAVGIALPFAASAALLFHSPDWGRRRLRFLYPLITPVVLAGILVVMYGARIQRGQGLMNHIPFLWLTTPPTVGYAAACLGLWLLPAAAGLFRKKELGLAAIHFVWIAALMGFVVSQKNFAKRETWPLFGEAFWRLSELGHITGGLPDNPPIPVSFALLWPATAVMAASMSVLLAAMWRRRGEPGQGFLLWSLGIYLFLADFIWLIYDRYMLVIAPLGIGLALSGKSTRRPILTGSLIAVLALASLIGTRDHLAYNRALWQGIGELRAIASDDDITAGFVPNHWLQRRHPELVYDIPREPETYGYQIATSPQPGMRVLKTIPYTRWLGQSGMFYLLQRE